MRNRIALVVSAMLVVGLVAGLTSSASGAGDPGATVAKKKKKVCPAGTHKVVVKKKNGKRKKKCVADSPTPTPTATTTLTISPATFTYPDTQHGTVCPVDAECVKQAFTVVNTGGAASGIPAASIVETNNPIPGDPPGFVVTGNTCTVAVAPGGSCTVTVGFQPSSNTSPQPYTAVLHVTATPGGDAQVSLSGTGN